MSEYQYSSYDLNQGSTKKQRFQNWISNIFFVCFLFSLISFSASYVISGSMLPTLWVGDSVVVSKIYPYGLRPYSIPVYSFIRRWCFPNFTFPTIGEMGLPDRGDVAVFLPRYWTDFWVKRIIAVGGDKVQMKKGRLYINEKLIPLRKLQENFKAFDGEYTVGGSVYEASLEKKNGEKIYYKILKQCDFGFGMMDNTIEFTVPKDHFFIMGDNWNGSSDSRQSGGIGFLHKDLLMGPALFICFSTDISKVHWYMPWTWWRLFWNIRVKRMGERLYVKKPFNYGEKTQISQDTVHILNNNIPVITPKTYSQGS